MERKGYVIHNQSRKLITYIKIRYGLGWFTGQKTIFTRVHPITPV